MDKESNPDIEKVDEDGVTDLVLEVFPDHSVLVFCDSKKRCENVSYLLANVINMKEDKREAIFNHRFEEKQILLSSLKADGNGFVCLVLLRTVPFGVAYHHSGLTMDERKLLEEAFASEVLGVLCCTSTLAAGINLPARRVVIRSPFMGRDQLSNAQYKQMVGRAGRAGLDTHGESFLLVKQNLTRLVPDIVTAPVERCVSSLATASQGKLLGALLLNCVHLGLVSTPGAAARLVAGSLLCLQTSAASVRGLVSRALQQLLAQRYIRSQAETETTQQTVDRDTGLAITKLGRACVAGNIDLAWAAVPYKDLAGGGAAQRAPGHLPPPPLPGDAVRCDHRGPRSLHRGQLPRHLRAAVRSRAGRGPQPGRHGGGDGGAGDGPPLEKLEPVLTRLYYALMLLDLWQAAPIHRGADKFQVSRGEVQSLMSSAVSFASSVYHFCQEIEEFWAYQELLEPFSRRLAHCCLPELLPLLELPGVKIGRARQLHSAGFTSVADIARAEAKQLVASVEHLSYKAANALIQAAKLSVIERIESLKYEAEIAMMDMDY